VVRSAHTIYPHSLGTELPDRCGSFLTASFYEETSQQRLIPTWLRFSAPDADYQGWLCHRFRLALDNRRLAQHPGPCRNGSPPEPEPPSIQARPKASP
jgi:hypothetical protein